MDNKVGHALVCRLWVLRTTSEYGGMGEESLSLTLGGGGDGGDGGETTIPKSGVVGCSVEG